MFFDWRIKGVQLKIERLVQKQENLSKAIDKEDYQATMRRYGLEREDAEATLVSMSERKVRLQKKLSKLRTKRFNKTLHWQY